jgi:hypothetical protein
VRVQDPDVQSHSPVGARGAGKARIEHTDPRFDAVENSFSDRRPVEEELDESRMVIIKRICDHLAILDESLGCVWQA